MHDSQLMPCVYKGSMYLLAVVGRKHRERRHGVDRDGLRDLRRKRLREERDTTLGLASRREELARTAAATLRDEERWRTETPLASLASVDLMIQELLDVLNGEQVLAVHGDDDGVPDLGHEDLESAVRRALNSNKTTHTFGLYLTSISPVARSLA